MYSIELISDNELVKKATCVYQISDLTSTKHSLDSTLFGANSTKHKQCQICGQRLDRCTSHYAVIELPMPIVNVICHDECVSLLNCLCPRCGHIILPEDVLAQVRKLNPESRFRVICSLVKKQQDKQIDSSFICPHCNKECHSTIRPYEKKETFVDIFAIMNPVSAKFEVISPIYAMEILQMFTQLEEVGWEPTFHPRNFMTNYIPIIPTKLRTKSIVNGQESASCLTTYYKQIIEQEIPKLSIIKNINMDKNTIMIDKSKLNEFIEEYTKLYAYYLLISDSGSQVTNEKLLNTLNKNFRLGYDSSSCLLKRFKGKSKSIFNKGIIGMVHDCACRNVLGAGEDVDMYKIGVPLGIANKLSIGYPVYKENLKFIKSLIISMCNNKIYGNPYIPKVLGWIPSISGKFQKFTPSTGPAIANKIQEGDVICISLFNGDFVMQSRHPVIREECLTSFQVKKEQTSTVGIPLHVCEIKQADFDGDEIQIYVCSDHVNDIESLLLHSVYTQMRSAGTGSFSFYYCGTHDDDLGVSRIGDFDIDYHNHQKVKPMNVLDEVEKHLPSDLTYKSSSLEITNGKINRNKTNFKDKAFYKFYSSVFGEPKCAELMDVLTHLGYEINRTYGASLGFEVRYLGKPEGWKRIQELKELAYKKSIELLKVNGKPTFESLNCFEEIKPEIKKILIEGAANSNLEKMNYTKAKAAEYQAMTVYPNHVKIEGEPVPCYLAEGTRTNFGGYKYSIDPCDYGFIKEGYNQDMSPYSHFFIVMDELKTIFTRTNSVATQGYMTKKMTVLFERAFADYNGCVVDNETHLANQYGQCGVDSRSEVVLTLEDIDLPHKEFCSKYSDKKLCELHDHLQKIRKHYQSITSFKKQIVPNGFITAIDFNQLFLDKYLGKTDQKEVDQFIDEMYEIFVPKALQNDKSKIIENFKHHEYYFRIMLSKYKLEKDLKDKLLKLLHKMLINAGDPVGSKCALAASAPMTQAMLSAIHIAVSSGGISVDFVKRPQGLNAFQQLIGGTKPEDTLFITIQLFDDSKEATEKFAHEQETFYYNEIWTTNEFHISKSIPENLLDWYGKHLAKKTRSPMYVVSTWNMIRISGFGIKTTDIINALMSSYPEIKFMLPYPINERQIKVYIYFDESVTTQHVYKLLRKWGKVKDSNVIHGRYLKNCYVLENVNNPGHYAIEANESIPGNGALNKIIFNPLVNPCKCLVSHPESIVDTYGIFEAEPRIYEQFLYAGANLSDTRELSSRVWKLICNVMTADGFMTYASALSMLHSTFGDLMKSLKFERAPLFLKNACQTNKKRLISENSSAAVFGVHSPMGDSVSQYIIYPN